MSDIGLFPFRYTSPFQDGGHFHDVTTRQNYIITMLKVFLYPWQLLKASLKTNVLGEATLMVGVVGRGEREKG